MRLTLRTLLAYMDEILEPGDREELTKKIESSDFANDLILRTKDTTRRLRLSAPQVVGTGMGLDPNTVAEYLDNILPPDAVADFERICLESDVHLAEVASAHHVLTMVLGEPADVDPVARQRMYAIPAEAERRKQMHVEPQRAPVVERPAVAPSRTAAAATSFAPALRPQASMHTVEVPDYLRASGWSASRLALGALAVVLLVAIGAMLMSGLGGWQGEPVAVNTSPPPSAEVPSAPAIGDTAALETAPPTVDPSVVETPATTATMPPVANALSGSPPRLALPSMEGESEATPPIESPSIASTLPSAAPEVARPQVAEEPNAYSTRPAEPDPYAVPASGNNVATSVPTTDVTPLPPQPVATTDTTPAVETSLPPQDEAAAPPVDETARVASAEVQPARPDTITSSPADAALAEQPAEEVAEDRELGTYLDGKNVLLRYDPSRQAWFRMPQRTALAPGDRLLALPAFHPKLSLATGLFVKLGSGTLLILGESSASGTPEFDLAYGRVVIVNTANNDNKIRFKLGQTSAEATLMPSATLAVEVVPMYIAGSDPREASAQAMVNLFVRDGSVDWNDGTVNEKIAAPSTWTITDGVASDRVAAAEFPAWIDEEPFEQRSEQLFGAPTIETELSSDQPAEQQLLVLYERSKRREVKSLAARSSMYVGQYIPFVAALRDSDQKSTWKMHIDTLRTAMSLGPDSAEQLYEALVDQRGEEAAADLYEMLCGYSADEIGRTPDEMKTGAISKLIDRLENDSLDYRVLAIQNLQDITGMRLLQNPSGSQADRSRGIRIWRERLKSGEVPLVKAESI
jgi:hypothetical protein